MTEQVQNNFEIKCKICGSNKVSIYFKSGYHHDKGIECGLLNLSCENCGFQSNIEETNYK